MLKMFQDCVTTFVDGKEILSMSTGRMMCEKTPEDETIKVTWDNVSDMELKLGWRSPFSVKKGWRGRYIVFDSVFLALCKDKPAPIKERKKPAPGIQVQVHWEEIDPPIEEILQWHEGNKAIQYLAERGLNLK